MYNKTNVKQLKMHLGDKDKAPSEDHTMTDEANDKLDSSLQFNEEERKTIDQQIAVIRRAHSVVNRKAMRRIDELFNEKLEIETSIP